MGSVASREDTWPSLPLESWSDTCATLHMWTQIVGKIRLVQSPWLNHSWHVTLYVTSRGLTTSPMPHRTRTFEIDFDFLDHQLVIRASDGGLGRLPLEPRSVAAFYRQLMDELGRLDLHVDIHRTPNEVPDPIRFDRDEAHRAYDREYANRFWRVLVQVDRVLKEFRAQFIGKCSPVHFFWGSFDLAVTRFSGRPAPPREGPAFMRDAYSHEVISHGFWPGNASLPEAALYAYAVPEPAGLKTAAVQPEGAYYHPELNEFILPYEVVRRSPSPGAAITAFVDTTYERAATLGAWDRASLERT